VVVDVNGVGYEVTLSGGVTGLKIGEKVDLVIHTDVKESAISLYGFCSPQEREVFLLLRKVKGIGPKVGLSILSTLGAEALLVSIGRGDSHGLQRVPGVGQKTAERILVELREYVKEILTEVAGGEEGLRIEIESGFVASPPSTVQWSASGSGGREALSPAANDTLLALERLGFSGERARSAVQRALGEGGECRDAGELLRRALAHC
jgi:Holliday junction DNA helicase RuvA subunit